MWHPPLGTSIRRSPAAFLPRAPCRGHKSRLTPVNREVGTHAAAKRGDGLERAVFSLFIGGIGMRGSSSRIRRSFASAIAVVVLTGALTLGTTAVPAMAA